MDDRWGGDMEQTTWCVLWTLHMVSFFFLLFHLLLSCFVEISTAHYLYSDFHINIYTYILYCTALYCIALLCWTNFRERKWHISFENSIEEKRLHSSPCKKEEKRRMRRKIRQMNDWNIWDVLLRKLTETGCPISGSVINRDFPWVLTLEDTKWEADLVETRERHFEISRCIGWVGSESIPWANFSNVDKCCSHSLMGSLSGVWKTRG